MTGEALKAAGLSKIALTREEYEKAERDLKDMLGFIEIIKMADTGMPDAPSFHEENHTKLRADEVKTYDEAAAILEAAPESGNGMFIVPETFAGGDS